MEAKVDPDHCTGCGICVQICPQVFEMRNDLAVAKTEVVPMLCEDACEKAAMDCPVDAIIIKDRAPCQLR